MQGAGNGRQQVDAPLAPLGVSATQESDSGVPQSESEYKGLDELLGKAKRGRDGEKEGGLTWDEESAIVSYKSGDSYGLNGKLSEGVPLTAYQSQLRDHLDTALEKLPVYQGTVYRHYAFDDFGGREALLQFLGKLSPDDPINLGGYLSVSMDPNTDRTGGQYTVDMVIDAKTARSINGFGANTEREAILARNVRLMPRSVERVGPYKFKITAEEYANGSGELESGELAAERVRHMREGEQGREDLRGISGRDPVGVPAENQGTAGREGYNTGLSGVSAGNRSAALDDAGMAADHAGTGAGSGAGPRTREVNDGLGGAVLRRILFMGRRSPGSGRSSELSDGGIFCG